MAGYRLTTKNKQLIMAKLYYSLFFTDDHWALTY